MHKTGTKRKHVTVEYFNYVKSELLKTRGKKTNRRYAELATEFDCSVPTIKRIEEAVDFAAFEKQRKERSKLATAAKINKESPSERLNIPKPSEIGQQQLFPQSDTTELARAIDALTAAIAAQTAALVENNKVNKDLRDRMAAANSLKAQELYKTVKITENEPKIGVDLAAPGSESKSVERIIDVKEKNKAKANGKVSSLTPNSI